MTENTDRIISPPFGMGFREWFEYRKGLEKKKTAVRAKVKRITKAGVSEEGYNYATGGDIFEEVKGLLEEEGLGFSVTVLSEWVEPPAGMGLPPVTKVKLLITWTDNDSGYPEEMQIIGSGADRLDKGVYKAYTGAEKYALQLTFMIPTGDDPEVPRPKPEVDKDGPPPEVKETVMPESTKEYHKQKAAQDKKKKGQQAEDKQAPEVESAEPDDKEPKEETKPQDAAEKPEEGGDDPVTPELLSKIKAGAMVIAGLSEEKNKKKAQEAVFESLKLKLKRTSADPATYTISEANKALAHIEEFTKQKKELKRRRDEAVQQEIEQRRRMEEDGQHEEKF